MNGTQNVKQIGSTVANCQPKYLFLFVFIFRQKQTAPFWNYRAFLLRIAIN